MRELVVYLGVSATLLPFLLFVGLGWPGDADSCVTEVTEDADNTCYCEAFDPDEIGEPGVRQPFNTWSNLYSLLTGSILAVFVYRNRTAGSSSRSRMGATNVFPLTYLGVVVFLGLGSMWFHASLVGWGGVFDNLSMYTFSNFILFYTLTRIVDDSRIFYVGYPVSVVAFTVLNATGAEGFALVSAAVSVYVVLELYIALWMPGARSDWLGALAFYLPALLTLGIAIGIWAASQTGGSLCDPDSWFQWHGVWHVLSGGTAMLLYFYWRWAPR